MARPRPEKKPNASDAAPDERGRRATFYTTGMEHSPTSATGTGWERTPWRAVQTAEWDALKRSCESTVALRETRLCEAG